MRFGVVVFPGSNCDRDCYHVLSHVLEQEVHYIWHEDRPTQKIDCVVLPGGFSYGDYLRSGAVARFSPVMDWIREYVHKGGLVIGICNGFQVLLESGLLEGAMLRNRSTRFICKDVYLRCESSKTPFTSEIREGELLRMPIAHAEGNYYASSDVIASLEDEDRVIFRYADERGFVKPDSNPNGSINNIAGICNKSRTVVGMMPHPERASEAILGGTDGLKLFTSVVRGL